MGWDKESHVGACGEVGMSMRDNVCPTLPVMVYQEDKAGHPEAVLSEKRLDKVGSEAGTEGVSWEGDMLGEVWVYVAALRDEGGIDVQVVNGQHVMVMCVDQL